jgi:hypothetical protein
MGFSDKLDDFVSLVFGVPILIMFILFAFGWLIIPLLTNKLFPCK